MTTTRPVDRITPAPVTVSIGNSSFRIPAVHAAEWIAAITDAQMELAILPGLLGDKDAERIVDLLVTEQITEKQLALATYRAITDASGRDWWVTVRLVGSTADETGMLLGELALRGVDPHTITLAVWVSAVYALLTRNLDEKERFKLNAQLMLVPDIEGLEVEDKPTEAEEVMRMLRSIPGARIG